MDPKQQAALNEISRYVDPGLLERIEGFRNTVFHNSLVRGGTPGAWNGKQVADLEELTDILLAITHQLKKLANAVK